MFIPLPLLAIVVVLVLAFQKDKEGKMPRGNKICILLIVLCIILVPLLQDSF